MLVLGLDVGTQGTRVLTCDLQGRIAAAAERSFPLTPASDLPPGWAEQDPRIWWRAACEAIGESMAVLAANGRGAADIKAVSVTSTSGTVCDVDSAGDPLGPAVMYNDQRSEPEAAEVNRAGAAISSKLGYKFAGSFGLPKMLWLMRHESERFRRARWLLSPTDFIIGRLSGEFGLTDYTNAFKTGYDLLQGRWPSFIEEILGIPLAKLPKVVAPGTRVGEITAAASDATRLAVGTPVVAGMTDGCASQVATGAVDVGDWNSTLGTTLVIKGVTRELLRDPLGRVYCHRHPDGHWLPGGASNTGGECIARRFDKVQLAALAAQARALTPTNLVIYPLTRKGERFPFNHASAEGFIVGEASDTATLYTAHLEGVAYVERMSYEVLANLGAHPSETVYIAGGAAKVDEWTQIRADVLQRTLLVPTVSGGAMGAAVVAAGAIAYDGVIRAARAMVRMTKQIEPRPQMRAAYDERYARFRAELSRRGYLQDSQ